jgi:hypothetical protein
MYHIKKTNMKNFKWIMLFMITIILSCNDSSLTELETTSLEIEETVEPRSIDPSFEDSFDCQSFSIGVGIPPISISTTVWFCCVEDTFCLPGNPGCVSCSILSQAGYEDLKAAFKSVTPTIELHVSDLIGDEYKKMDVSTSILVDQSSTFKVNGVEIEIEQKRYSIDENGYVSLNVVPVKK